MESLGRFWYYLKATQGPHCCVSNFRTTENSYRGWDIWREVLGDIKLFHFLHDLELSFFSWSLARQHTRTHRRIKDTFSSEYSISGVESCPIRCNSRVAVEQDTVAATRQVGLYHKVIPLSRKGCSFRSTLLQLLYFFKTGWMLALTRCFFSFWMMWCNSFLDKGEYLCLLPQHRLALTAALGVVHLGRHDHHEDLHIMWGCCCGGDDGCGSCSTPG